MKNLEGKEKTADKEFFEFWNFKNVESKKQQQNLISKPNRN